MCFRSATECAALGCRGSNYPTFKKASNARTVGLGKNKLPRSIHVSLPANITGLSLTSILDNDRIKAPRGYHKQQKARQMKRFADLALMSCCPLEAAIHATQAITELRAANDPQWYAGLTQICMEVPYFAVEITGTACENQTTEEKLEVSACACEALDELLKYPIHLAPLAAVCALRYQSPNLIFLRLIGTCTKNVPMVHTFDAVGRGHVAAAGSIIYSRECGNFDGATALLSLICSMANAWDLGVSRRQGSGRDSRSACWSRVQLAALKLLMQSADKCNLHELRVEAQTQSLWLSDMPVSRPESETSSSLFHSGERHATVVCIKNPLKIRIVLVSAHLDFCGMECVAHHHCFKGLVLAVGETVSLSLDASPLQSEYDIELRGVDLLLMDVTPSIAQQAAKIQINAKSAGQKTKLSNVRRVVSPQPRPTVAISFKKTMAGSQEPPASYMPHIAAGSSTIRPGERATLHVVVNNLSDIHIDKLEIWAAPYRPGEHVRSLLFCHPAEPQFGASDEVLEGCHLPLSPFLTFEPDEQDSLRQQLEGHPRYLHASIQLQDHFSRGFLGGQIQCTISSGGFTRNTSGTFALTKNLGLVCTKIDSEIEHSYYHFRNDAAIPFQVGQLGTDVWYYIRSGAHNTRLKLLSLGTLHWRVEGAQRPEFDGFGYLARPKSRLLPRNMPA
ncbi:hypothetical protein AURANDRAFT_67411 [Aureococcus anophagefferens]|uniref:Uncharacterized protein n=1 Tax=Aureococcus anophagefferens TaxID=44056 RepID=F0YL18_AURAN|nr:hypothetical protein AURANDRAFT_67411 [Aureococcus anophagefferens]EGB04225.1 hypothetical protein AURANDRAFT_67411 [Aureococcus anophagefferens]|eukprot:XP_009041076.1 hypothetical protein AURANDRAFT_67411 [Aureococcus anophagefferens]